MKSSKPSKTKIRQVLTNCAFDPRKPGPMKIVTDLSDKNYCLRQASILINQSYCEENIMQAIQLLALALVKE